MGAHFVAAFSKPSKMSQLFALPKRAVMCTLECAFCEDKSKHYAYCASQYAVFACKKPDHIAFAEQSKKVWLGLRKQVLFQDVCMEPLFCDTDILSIDVAVERSEKLEDGSFKIDLQGWNIVKPFVYHEPITIGFSPKTNSWMIDVQNIEEDNIKSIPLDKLKMSLGQDKHELVDLFVEKLNSGFFYHEDLAAFQMLGSTYNARKQKSVPEFGWV